MSASCGGIARNKDLSFGDHQSIKRQSHRTQKQPGDADMPYLYFQIEDGSWQRIDLTAALCVQVDQGRVRYSEAPAGDGTDAFALVPHGAGGRPYYSLISAQEPRINGVAMHAAIRVLEDRDEIIIKNARFCFSAQTIARAEPFHPLDASKSVACPVCRDDIRAGSASQRCSACSSIHHEECWRILSECSTYGCAQKTHAEEPWAPESERRPGERQRLPVLSLPVEAD
jgi:hypothetical protein